MVQFRVLGSVDVVADDGSVLTLSRRQERAVLAILLLEAGRTVPVDRIREILWETNELDRGRQAIRTFVTRIRALLARAGSVDAAVVLSEKGGYCLKVDPDAVDALRFRAL